jgi:hypothetical protein
VPSPARNGRLVVSSLAELSLDRLYGLAAAR